MPSKKKVEKANTEPGSNRDLVAQLADQHGWERRVLDHHDVYHFSEPSPIKVDDIAIGWAPDTELEWRMVTLNGHRGGAVNNRESLTSMMNAEFGDPGGVRRFGLEYLVQRGAQLAGQYAAMHPAQAQQEWLKTQQPPTQKGEEPTT